MPDSQVLHSFKVFDVVRDKHKAVMNRRGTDQEVKLGNWLAESSQSHF